MELYEIANQAIFDEPVEYKGVKIYPITIRYYQIVKVASTAFAVNTAADTDIELIGLPYMEYLMKKAQKEPEFVDVWNIFNSILQLSFGEQIHFFRYEGDFLKLVIATPTEKYNEETMCVYREKLSKYNELAVDGYHELLNKRQISQLKEEIDKLAGEMFVFHTFDDDDFSQIKKIICYLNDIDETIVDPKWEAELKKANQMLNEINKGKESPSTEDLIDAVAFHLHKLPNEIQNMTVRRFDRYLDLELNKEDYDLLRSAELNGTEFKRPIKHWLKGYKPKWRYFNAQNNGGGVQEVLKK